MCVTTIVVGGALTAVCEPSEGWKLPPLLLSSPLNTIAKNFSVWGTLAKFKKVGGKILAFLFLHYPRACLFG